MLTTRAISRDLDKPARAQIPANIRRCLGVLIFTILTLTIWHAAADGPMLYIKDTPADTGIEPDPDPNPMYASPDIWVRQKPISGHTPYPFSVDPAWLTAITPLNENPIYRDPKYSKPNYVYVRVRNGGTSASAGTERLRVYWAKGSTGLGWPNQWVDYLDTTCGPTNLYGIEITDGALAACLDL